MVSSGLRDNSVYVAGSDDISRCIKDSLKLLLEKHQHVAILAARSGMFGACVNAPILQVNDDFYEDMDYQATARLLDELAVDNKPEFGSVIGRQDQDQKMGLQHLRLLKTASRSN